MKATSFDELTAISLKIPVDIHGAIKLRALRQEKSQSAIINEILAQDLSLERLEYQDLALRAERIHQQNTARKNSKKAK